MKPEEHLKYLIENPHYLVVAGSRLYGTVRPESDDDKRGWLIPPFEYLVGIKSFQEGSLPGEDYKVFSLHSFLKLCLGGDPLCTEMLFVSGGHVLKSSFYAQQIIEIRDKIVSQRMCNRIIGYSYSEWRKAFGQKLEIDKRTKTEDDVINDIRNLFGPDKEDMDEVIRILFSKHPRKIVSTTRKLGAKRKEQMEKYGYCVSSATHSIRLLGQLYEILTEGRMTFPRPNADILKQIRTGQMSKDELENIYNDILRQVEEAKLSTDLRLKPDEDFVWKTYRDIIIDFFKTDEYCKKIMPPEHKYFVDNVRH